jgi:hypothetical protein
MNRRIRTWLQLVRAPNLFTVGGDPLAGFFLANFGIPTADAFPPILASFCLYAAGLVDNDLADLQEDLRDRPGRPLPSGAISPRTARIVAVLLTAAALALSALAGGRCLLTAAALTLTVLAYNHFLKRLPGIGPVSMGLCRGLSLLLGATAAPAAVFPSEVFLAAAGVVLWIASVTHLARHETLATIPNSARMAPVAGLLFLLGSAFFWEPMGTPPWALMGSISLRVLIGIAFLQGLLVCIGLKPGTPVPPRIGKLIRLLLPIQAAFCASTGLFGILAGLLLLALWPLSQRVSRSFYAS